MLLSRVADHLYWMSRYLERAEHTARLIDVSLNMMLEQAPQAAERRFLRLLRSLHVQQDADAPTDAYHLTQRLTFDAGTPNAIVSCIASARENAQHVRELISSEMWEQINLLYLHISRTRMDTIWNAHSHDFFRAVKEGSHLFQGITDSTMTQGEGWQFIQIGRYIERASSIAALVDVHFTDLVSFAVTPDPTDGHSDYLDWVGLLKSCTAFEAYCKIYTPELKAHEIADFLLLNPDFPHTVCFSVFQLEGCLREIAEITETHRAARLNRLAGRLRAMLEFGQIEEIIGSGLVSSGLHDYLGQVQGLCAAIHSAISNTYITYAIDKELQI